MAKKETTMLTCFALFKHDFSTHSSAPYVFDIVSDSSEIGHNDEIFKLNPSFSSLD
jgi:hypothetical protein